MLLNLNQKILTLSGKPYKKDKSDDSDDLFLRDVLVVGALNAKVKDGKSLDQKSTQEIAWLAKQINDSDDIELTAKELVFLTDAVFEVYKDQIWLFYVVSEMLKI